MILVALVPELFRYLLASRNNRWNSSMNLSWFFVRQNISHNVNGSTYSVKQSFGTRSALNYSVYCWSIQICSNQICFWWFYDAYKILKQKTTAIVARFGWQFRISITMFWIRVPCQATFWLANFGAFRQGIDFLPSRVSVSTIASKTSRLL